VSGGTLGERFTDRARDAMRRANAEAAARGRRSVLPEEMLIGILLEGTGIGVHAMKACGADLGSLLEGARGIAALLVESPVVGGSMDGSPLAKAIVAEAIRVASDNDHDHVGTEHLAVALARFDAGPLSELFRRHSITPVALEEAVLKFVPRGYRPEPPDLPPPGKHHDLYVGIAVVAAIASVALATWWIVQATR
jgi:ATP-dependent Clp protease ATP-binding subunit ClpA